MNVGRYEMLDQIGAGSMGKVFRARDPVLNRFVALKVMRCPSTVEPELKERFYREAWACARLAHPGIVTVHDLGECDDSAYIAMELLSGTDFRKIIDRQMEIALETKIAAIAHVCEALAHAHKNGILHRDIKPSNLFLTDGGIAKVLDFGMARLPGSRLTAAGRAPGTPNYMAPEQIVGASTDERSDLFSLAVVSFELLVYTHPFESDDIPRGIVHGKPASLSVYDAKLPEALGGILARALSKEPHKRFATGDEFAAALRSLLPPRGGGADAIAAPPAARKACRYCGASNRAAALYCIHCGGRLSPTDEAPPASAPPATPATRLPRPAGISLDATAILERPDDALASGDVGRQPDKLEPAKPPRVAFPPAHQLPAPPHKAKAAPPARRRRIAVAVLAVAIGMLLVWVLWLRKL
jgi:serine/threonine-protein kinase